MAAPTIADAFGRALREEREREGLSQEGLAERAGVHRTFVGLVERGERNVTLPSVFRLASGLECSAADLVGRAEQLAR